MSVKGYPFIGKLKEHWFKNMLYATVNKVGFSKAALDVIHRGYFLLNSGALYTAEAGSTDNILKITGHGFKEGDLVRLQTTANAINEFEIIIDEIVDANNVRLAGYLSASLTAGDTMYVSRPISERFDSSGATLASVTMPPIKIQKKSGGLTTDEFVLQDIDTPANTQAVPVMLYGASGTLAITSDTLDLHLTHAGTQQDSVAIGNGDSITPVFWALNNVSGAGLVEAVDLDIRNLSQAQDNVKIGDGTSFIGIDAGTNELKVRDPDMRTATGTIADVAETDHTASATVIQLLKGALSRWTTFLSRMPASLGQLTKANSLSVTIASDQGGFAVTAADLDIRDLTHVSDSIRLGDGTSLVGVHGASNSLNVRETNPLTGFATSAKQDTAQTSLTAIEGYVDGLEALIGTTNTNTGNINTSIGTTNTKLDAIIAAQVPQNGSLYSSSIAINGTATATAPANALGCIIKNAATSLDTLFFNIGGAADNTSFDLLPGQSTSYMPNGKDVTFKVDAAAAGACTALVQWIVK